MSLVAKLIGLSGVLALILLVAGGDAVAGGRKVHAHSVHKEVTRTGPDGRSHTWQKDVTRQRTPTGTRRSTTWTDARGRTATREAEVTRDPEAGTRTRDVVFTGRNGQTRTRHDVITRTEDGFQRTTTVTKSNGDVVTTVTDVSRERVSGGGAGE